MSEDQAPTTGASDPPSSTDPPVDGSPPTQPPSPTDPPPPTGPPVDGPPPTAPPSPPRRLERSQSDRLVAGVCGGLGRHFGVDAVIFRILFPVLAVIGGLGPALYVAAWLLLPVEGGRPSAADSLLRRGGGRWVPVALIVVGALFLADEVLPSRSSGLVLAVVLIAVGVALWQKDRHPPSAPSPGATGAAAPPAEAEAVAVAVEPESPTRVPASGRGSHRGLAPATVSVLLLLGGLALALGGADVLEVSPEGYLAVALLVTGAALMVAARTGRSLGLVALGGALSAALVVAAAVDVPLGEGAGERRWAPATLSELDDEYRLGAGEATLDLGDLDLDGASRDVDVSLGAGELLVVAPEDADLEVEARASLGEVQVLGRNEEGAGASETATERGRPGGGRLGLDLRVGLGRVEVSRAG